MELIGLPGQFTRFIGRTREVAQARALLRRHRVVTLLGPPGAGKTRLAIEVARRLAEADASEVAFVDLARLDPDLGVATAVVTALGLDLQPGERAEQAVERRLRRLPPLVVLDTCEHVLEPVTILVNHWLAACPDVRLLATSREPLGVPGEVRLKVPPLRMPVLATAALAPPSGAEAVGLFLDRARLADPGLVLTAEALAEVGAICRHLDGNPLAIELAAGLVGALPLADIRAGLRDRFQLLSAPRAAASRQRSLQAAMEWSYGLLAPDERRAFQRVAVFATDFSAASARAVLVGDDLAEGQVLSLLAGLVHKSLLERADQAMARYRLLESPRHFAWRRLLEQPEAGRVVRRAAAEAASRQAHRTAVRLLEEALRLMPGDGAERPELLDQLSGEAERAGLYQVGVRALEALRAITAERPAGWHGRLLVRLSNLLVLATGDLAAADLAATSAATRFSEVGDHAAALSAATQSAWLRGLGGDLSGQAVAAAALVVEAQARGEQEAVLHAQGCLGAARAFLGDFAAARAALGPARRLAADRGAPHVERWVSAQLAFVAALEGDLGAARAALPPLLGEEAVEPVAFEVMALVSFLAGDYRGVVELVRTGANALGALGVRGGWALALAAAAAAETGQVGLADDLADRARTLFAGRPLYAHYHAQLWMLGVVRWCRLDLTEAIELLSEAGRGLLAMGCRPLAALCLYDLAAVFDDAHRDEEAAACRHQLAAVAAGLSGPLFAALPAVPALAARDFARLGLPGLQARALVAADQLEAAARVLAEVGCAWRQGRVLAALAERGLAPMSPAARALARAVVFDGLPAATLEALASRSAPAHFAAGEVVARRGEPIGLIAVVAAGRLKASRGTSHGDSIATLVGPGDLVGERGLIVGARHALDVVALDPCDLVGVRRDDLLGLLADAPVVGERLIVLLRQRLRADAALGGEPVATDIAAEVISAIQRLSGRAAGTVPSYEILPVYLADAELWWVRPRDHPSWQVPALAEQSPGALVGGALAERGLQAEIVHSTSWRYERERLVLTYLAIMPAVPVLPAGFTTEPVRRVDLARGSATDAPQAIAVDQVVEHGLRHLAWLAKDDPVIGHELSPAWLALVQSYVPEPFRAL